MRAIVTGGASGLGAAIVSRLRSEGFEVDVLDLTTGFDVTDPAQWERSARSTWRASTPACSAGEPDPAEIDLDAYRRAMAVNVDGVVLGVRRLAQVMPAGGRIVATASLAGLTAMPDDPVYAATKHAVVGFVRSIAPRLAARGISINAVCPGIADTPMITGRRPERARGGRLPARPGRRRGRRGLAGARVGPHRACLGDPARAAADRLPLPERPRRPHRRRRDRPSTPARAVTRISFSSDDAPRAVGPYSQAVESGDHVFLSGQTPIDPATGTARRGRRRSAGRPLLRQPRRPCWPRPGSRSTTSSR